MYVLKVHVRESILLQIRSEQWYGEFIDIEDPAMMIPDKSVIKVKILQVFYFSNSNRSVHGILKLFINVCFTNPGRVVCSARDHTSEADDLVPTALNQQSNNGQHSSVILNFL